MNDYILKTVKVGFLNTNCYVLKSKYSDSAVVIDPGAEGILIKSIMRDMDARCSLILLTHGHFDHILALGDLRMEKTKVALHKNDANMLLEKDLLSSMLDYDPRPFKEADLLLDEGTYNIDGFKFDVMHTPGHTKGSVCYIFEDIIFTGDTLFNGGIGRTDFTGGSDLDMKKSLERLYNIPGDYAIYPGHEGSSVLSDEKKYNPYMQQFKK